MKIKFLLLVSSFAFLVSCAHTYPVDPSPDDILSTSSGKEKPEWAIEKPRYVKKDNLYVSGLVEIDGSQSPARGLLAADLQARANLLSELKTRLHAQLQYATEGFDIDQQRLNNIITESIDVHSLSGLYIAERFYEKVRIGGGYYPREKYICYSLATISLPDFKEAIARNLKEDFNKPFSENFDQKVDKAWDKFFYPNEPS